MNSDENIPYRTSVIQSVMADDTVTKDEADYETLRLVYDAFKRAMDDLDKWHAFDIEESELKIKQQIAARRLAYDILAPLLSAVESALAVVNDKYKQR